MGRPRIQFDLDEVEKLGILQCTYEEVAAFFGCHVDTITQRMKQKAFSEAFTKGRDNGKSSLRRAQYRAAINGNVSMMIWLGKQWLGQKDKQEIGGPDGGAIPFEGAIVVKWPSREKPDQ